MRRLVFSVFALPLLLSCSDKGKAVCSLDSGEKRDSSSLTLSEPVVGIDNYREPRRRAFPLAALHKARDGPNWENKTNWQNYDVPLSEWHGVETDRTGRIIGLGLAENELEGSIPAELGQLTNLEVLNLRYNEIIYLFQQA